MSILSDFRPAVVSSVTGRTIPYRVNGVDGHMLQLIEMGTTPVRLPCPIRGPHRIHLGFRGASAIRLRFVGDSFFRWVETSIRWDADSADGEEVYWRTADLTGQDLEFLPQPLVRRSDLRQSQIAYVRFEPTTTAERAPRLPATRTAGAVIDGHEMLGTHAPQTKDDVCGMLAPLLDSDFRRLAFGCSCTTMRMTYLTQVGHWLGQDQADDDLHSDANRRCAAALRAGERQGYDPVDVLIEMCRANDTELWADFRIQQDYPFDYAGGFGADFNSPFTHQHQDWRHVDRQGQVASHNFSHFHDGWQQHKLDLLAELARKGPAGIHLNLACELGALWDFEPGAVARYREQTGVDLSQIDEPMDEPPDSWYQFRCDHFTEFIRRLRAQTQQIAVALGQPIPIAVQVSGEWSILKSGSLVRAVSQNWLSGFDVGRWVREGLVDVVSPSFRRTYKPMFLEHLWDELGDARAGVRVIPSIGQHDNAVFPRGYEWALYFTDEGEGRQDLLPFGELDAWRILREAHDLYCQGADAVDVWEMGYATVRLGRWNVLRQIGDRALLMREFGTRIGGLLAPPEEPLRFEDNR